MSKGVRSRFEFLFTDDEEEFSDSDDDSQRGSYAGQVDSAQSLLHRWTSVLMTLLFWMTLITPTRLVTSAILSRALKGSAKEIPVKNKFNRAAPSDDRQQDFCEFEHELEEFESHIQAPLKRVEVGTQAFKMQERTSATPSKDFPGRSERLFRQDSDRGNVTSRAGGFLCEIPTPTSTRNDGWTHKALEPAREEELKERRGDQEDLCVVVGSNDICRKSSSNSLNSPIATTICLLPRVTSSSTDQEFMPQSEIAKIGAEGQGVSVPIVSQQSHENSVVCKPVDGNCATGKSSIDESTNMDIDPPTEIEPMEIETLDETRSSVIDRPIDCDSPKDTLASSFAEEVSRSLIATRSPRDSWSSESPLIKITRLRDSIDFDITTEEVNSMTMADLTVTPQSLSPGLFSETVSISSSAISSNNPNESESSGFGSAATPGEDQVPATPNEVRTTRTARKTKRGSIEIFPTGPDGQLSYTDISKILSQGVSIEDIKKAVNKRNKLQPASSSPFVYETVSGLTPTVKHSPGPSPYSSGFWSGQRKKKISWMDGRYEIYSSRESTPGRYSEADQSDSGQLQLELDAVRRQLNYNQ